MVTGKIDVILHELSVIACKNIPIFDNNFCKLTRNQILSLKSLEKV